MRPLPGDVQSAHTMQKRKMEFKVRDIEGYSREGSGRGRFKTILEEMKSFSHKAKRRWRENILAYGVLELT